MDKIIKQFARKWDMDEKAVFNIYAMIRDSGRRYGKTSRTLMRFNVKISPRQLKYFYRKYTLTIRYGNATKLGKSQYRRIVEKRS